MKKSITYGGPSTLSLLGLIFIVLKLLGYINWSWVWVLSPFWIPLAIIIVCLVIGLLFALFVKR